MQNEVNLAHHNMLSLNALQIGNYLGGHLEYKRGKGARQKQRCDCQICKELGWDDNHWHPVSNDYPPNRRG